MTQIDPSQTTTSEMKTSMKKMAGGKLQAAARRHPALAMDTAAKCAPCGVRRRTPRAEKPELLRSEEHLPKCKKQYAELNLQESPIQNLTWLLMVACNEGHELKQQKVQTIEVEVPDHNGGIHGDASKSSAR